MIWLIKCLKEISSVVDLIASPHEPLFTLTAKARTLENFSPEIFDVIITISKR